MKKVNLKKFSGFVQLDWLSDLKRLGLRDVRRGVYDSTGELVGDIFPLNGRRYVGFYSQVDAEEYCEKIKGFNKEELVYKESDYPVKYYDSDGNFLRKEIKYG